MQVSEKRLIFVISNKQTITTKSNIMKITIEKINFFANVEYDEDFNAKIVYKKYGKTYLAAFFVCFFHRRIYIPKQPKFHKALVGLQKALEIHYFNKL